MYSVRVSGDYAFQILALVNENIMHSVLRWLLQREHYKTRWLANIYIFICMDAFVDFEF